jgi:hypothetical protein
LDKINEAFEKATSEINKSENPDHSVETDYFIMKRYKKPGFSGVKIDLKPDKIKFNPDIKAPLVFVDEAAHMNTL